MIQINGAEPTRAEIGTILAAVDAEVAAILADVAGLAGDAMRGTDGAALASAWTAALATVLADYTSVRAGYLDELDFDLAAAIAAIPTTMVGTNGAALASAWTAPLAAALTDYTAVRAAYLDELAAANLPTDVSDVKGVVDAIPTEGYFEQTVPLLMNGKQTLNNVAADADFIGDNLTGAVGLISTADAKVQKVMLLIIGRAVNVNAGTNALDCTTAAHNQWQINLDGGGYADLVNEEADGQMLDDDWRCAVEGASYGFTFMFDVTSVVTNIDGKIGVRLENGRAEAASLIVTCDMYLKVMYKL